MNYLKVDVKVIVWEIIINGSDRQELVVMIVKNRHMHLEKT